MTPAHLDRVAVAVKHQLRDCADLVTWTGGEGRIVRVGNLAEVAGLPPREIAIGTTTAEPIFEPGEAASLSLGVGLRFVWEEHRRILGDDESTVAAVVDTAWRHLLTNHTLKRPETGDVPLTRRLHSYQPVDFRAIREEGTAVQLSLVVVVEYRARVHLPTWEILP